MKKTLKMFKLPFLAFFLFIRVTLPFFLMLLCYYSFMNKAIIL